MSEKGCEFARDEAARFDVASAVDGAQLASDYGLMYDAAGQWTGLYGRLNVIIGQRDASSYDM